MFKFFKSTLIKPEIEANEKENYKYAYKFFMLPTIWIDNDFQHISIKFSWLFYNIVEVCWLKIRKKRVTTIQIEGERTPNKKTDMVVKYLWK